MLDTHAMYAMGADLGLASASENISIQTGSGINLSGDVNLSQLGEAAPTKSLAQI